MVKTETLKVSQMLPLICTLNWLCCQAHRIPPCENAAIYHLSQKQTSCTYHKYLNGNDLIIYLMITIIITPVHIMIEKFIGILLPQVAISGV